MKNWVWQAVSDKMSLRSSWSTETFLAENLKRPYLENKRRYGPENTFFCIMIFSNFFQKIFDFLVRWVVRWPMSQDFEKSREREWGVKSAQFLSQWRDLGQLLPVMTINRWFFKTKIHFWNEPLHRRGLEKWTKILCFQAHISFLNTFFWALKNFGFWRKKNFFNQKSTKNLLQDRKNHDAKKRIFRP